MDTSALQLTVIYMYTFTFLCLTLLNGFSTAETTINPVQCYGMYAYERTQGYHGRGANRYSNENTLTKCKNFCSNMGSCDSFDYNYGENACWIHTTSVENQLYRSTGIDHFEKVACPTPASTTGLTTIITTLLTSEVPTATTIPGSISDCVDDYSYDEFVDTYVLGGAPQSQNTLLDCLKACSSKPITGAGACTALDFSESNGCFFFSSPADSLDKRTDDSGIVSHYVREPCTSTSLPTTAPTTTIGTTTPSPNAFVSFTLLFTNDYDATVRDVDDFIDTVRTQFCDDAGIDCNRLLKPRTPEDVKKVLTKENPGPDVGSIMVDGMLAPAGNGEKDTETVMTKFGEDQYDNFRYRLGPNNDNIRLLPDTSNDYDGFTWERLPTTDAPAGKEEEEEGPLGLKLEYWILIGLAVLALIVTIIAIVVICCLRSKSSSDSSDDAQKKKEKRREERERKKEEKEEKKRAAKEKKDRKNEEKEQKKKDSEKDVEKGDDDSAYQEPEDLPDDSPSGLSEDDKAY